MGKSTRISKNASGYGYKYTDLAEIHKHLEEEGWAYYQFVEPAGNGFDYIMTVKIDKDGKESAPIQGCRIPEAKLSGKNNPAQEYGSALTYARRYSLLMAFGLATTDDDAESLTVSTADSNASTPQEEPAMMGALPSMLDLATPVEKKTFLQRCEADNVDYRDIAKRAGATTMKSMTKEQLGKALIILGEIEGA